MLVRSGNFYYTKKYFTQSYPKLPKTNKKSGIKEYHKQSNNQRKMPDLVNFLLNG